MRADVEQIVELLSSQVLFAGDEAQIVEIFRRRLDSDRQAAEHGGPAGTPLLNQFIAMLRRRAFPRATARTGWIESWVNAWDTLFYELEDERLEEFKSIVAPSGTPAAAKGPEGANSENLGSTMGELRRIGACGGARGDTRARPARLRHRRRRAPGPPPRCRTLTSTGGNFRLSLRIPPLA